MHRRLFAFWLGVALVSAAIMYIRWERFGEVWWWFAPPTVLALFLSADHLRKLIRQR